MTVSCKSIDLGCLYKFLALMQVPKDSWAIEMQQFVEELNFLQLNIKIDSDLVENFLCFKFPLQIKSIDIEVDEPRQNKMEFGKAAHKLISELLMMNKHITIVKITGLKFYFE